MNSWWASLTVGEALKLNAALRCAEYAVTKKEET